MPKNRVENRKDSFWNRSLFYVFLTSEKEEPTPQMKMPIFTTKKGRRPPSLCFVLDYFSSGFSTPLAFMTSSTKALALLRERSDLILNSSGRSSNFFDSLRLTGVVVLA